LSFSQRPLLPAADVYLSDTDPSLSPGYETNSAPGPTLTYP